MGKLNKRLARRAGMEALVRIDRKPIDNHTLDGFIVAAGPDLLILHVVNGSTLKPNGYCVVRTADIRKIKPDRSFVPRALSLLERRPAVPHGIDLSDWISLLASVNERYPLLMLEFERKEPGCGFVGRIEKVE